MKWLTKPIGKVAPAREATQDVAPDDSVWHLTLDQIESGTGWIINKRIAPTNEAGSSIYIFDSGNVLLSKLRPYLNKVVCPEEVGIATTELIPLRPNPDVLDRRFLMYYLRSSQYLAFANVTVAGVKMPRLIMPKFWRYEVPLPPLSEQRRIVEIMDQADALRKKRAEADAKAARILPALFYKMFGDPATNPKGWPVEPLTKICRPKQWPTISSKELTESGFPVYGANGQIGFYSSYNHEFPTVLITCRGATCGTINICPPKCYVTGNAMALDDLDYSKTSEYFLATYLHVRGLKDTITGGAQPQITKTNLKNVTVFVPPQPILENFSKRAVEIERLLSSLDGSRKNIERCFHLLLHRAFTGDLTAKWREAHKEQLESEMQEQMAALEEAKTNKPKHGHRRKAVK